MCVTCIAFLTFIGSEWQLLTWPYKKSDHDPSSSVLPMLTGNSFLGFRSGSRASPYMRPTEKWSPKAEDLSLCLLAFFVSSPLPLTRLEREEEMWKGEEY